MAPPHPPSHRDDSGQNIAEWYLVSLCPDGKHDEPGLIGWTQVIVLDLPLFFQELEQDDLDPKRLSAQRSFFVLDELLHVSGNIIQIANKLRNVAAP